MKLRATLFAAAAVITMGLAGTAAAQTAGVATPPADTPGQDVAPPEPTGGFPDVSVNFGVASDYVFRGISQTAGDAQFFGGVDATSGQFYAGAWVSNVDFGNGTDLEFDLYGGFKPEFMGMTLDLGVIYYGYTDQPSGSDEDYFEAKAAASTTYAGVSLGVAGYYSPEFFGGTGDAFYGEVSAAYAIVPQLTVSGAVGRQWVKGPADYTTENVGFIYTPVEHIGIDFRYFNMKNLGLGEIDDDRFTVGIKLTY